MNVQTVAMQMVALFLLVIAGYVSRKCNLMSEDFDRKLSNLVIQVTAPFLILASTMGETMPERDHILPLLGVGAATYALLIVLAYVIPRFMPVKTGDRGMYSFMLTYSNVGFIGYPIVASLFGPSAVFYACILNVPNTLTIFVWGIMFVTGEKSGKFNPKLLLSPAMVATYLSIIIVAFGWRAPTVIAQPLTLLGNMTVPASLLIIGSSIGGMSAKLMVGSRGAYVMCVLKLLLLPLGLFHLFLLLGVDRQIDAINAVLIGMPVASFGTMFCMKYGKDSTVMTQGTFLSTLLSVLSIPLLALLIM